MEISDLKTGMAVQLINGDKYIVMKDTLAGIGTDNVLSLCDYHNDLDHIDCCDFNINKVTEVLDAGELMNFQQDFLSNDKFIYNRQVKEQFDKVRAAVSIISEFLDSEDHEITNINIGMDNQVDLIYLNNDVQTISKCEDDIDFQKLIRNYFTPRFD